MTGHHRAVAREIIEQRIARGHSTTRIMAELGITYADVKDVRDYLDAVHNNEPIFDGQPRNTPAGVLHGTWSGIHWHKQQHHATCGECREFSAAYERDRRLSARRAENPAAVALTADTVTHRENAVARLTRAGLTVAEIAEHIGVTPRTVTRIRARIRARLRHENGLAA